MSDCLGIALKPLTIPWNICVHMAQKETEDEILLWGLRIGNVQLCGHAKITQTQKVYHLDHKITRVSTGITSLMTVSLHLVVTGSLH